MRKYASLCLVLIILSVSVISTTLITHAQGASAWAPNTPYSVNQLVTYGGQTYKCLQAHTSQVGWEPSNVPALWQVQSGSVPTATTGGPTATKTNTPIPPTATTGGGGSCTSPAYNSATAYTGGMQVSYNGHTWKARWWTQGEAPSTGGTGVWQDLGACSGATATSVPPTPTFVPPTYTPIPGTPTKTPVPPTAQPGGPVILGYFAEWGVYARNYQPKNIVTSGSASKITHINFAFGNVTNGQCVIGDAYADYDKAYDAASSVDGVADTWDTGALRGVFNQFRKLKIMYPNIKILWSFGGWTWSGGFGQAAANATAFANSCYNLVFDPRWNGVFDGIDIDWEYPNACGLSCDTSGFGSYKTLMQALRTKFGTKLVTAAIPAGTNTINAADYAGAAQYVNWYNIMTYDFFGAFNAQGPTALHSALTAWPGMPTTGGQDKFHSDAAVQLLKSKGIPASKLHLGIGFYGRGWTNVANVNGGLNQPANGAAPGTYEPGIEDYKVLVNTCPATGTAGGTAYAFCGGKFWSYDTPATIASKMTYKKNQGLGGAFFWEFSGDTANGALITAMYNNR
jgi:chitinase